MKIVFLLLVSFSLHAQIVIDDCVEAGKYYGSQQKVPVLIPTECKDVILSKDILKVSSISNSEMIKAYGHTNLLYIRIFQLDEKNVLEQTADHFISGAKSKLTNIIDIKISELDQKVYVLNENNGQYSIYSYFYSSGGNIVPARKLITTEIKNATSFRIDSESKELAVMSSSEGWIKFFHIEADPDGKRAKNSNSVLRLIEGALESPQDILFIGSIIYVIDNNKVLVFDKNMLKDSEPKTLYSSQNKRVNFFKKILISDNSKNLLIICDDGSQIELTL